MEVKALLRQYGLHPKKSLGQNFLVDEHALSNIVRAATITSADVVLEIGPGLGSLTRHLSDAARRVIAVEIDRTLILPLQSVLAARSNVTLVAGDILQLDPAELLSAVAHPSTARRSAQDASTQELSHYLTNQLSNYKVVANIPYYITSAVIRHLLEADIKPQSIVLTVQLEVAQRIIAEPDDMNLLAVSVQFYGVPRIVQRIPAGAFYPVPVVDSAVVRIDLPDQPRVMVNDVDTFFKVAKAGFGQRRKQLHNALKTGLSRPAEEIDRVLKAAQIDPKRRAETLTLEEWAKLANQFIS